MSRLIKKILADKLSPEELNEVISGFDVIGDIAILKIPDKLLPKKYLIAKTLLENVKSIRCVFRQVSPISGEYRLMELEHLAGEDRTYTEYRESGCRFYVDIAKVYFSPRLSGERLRITNLVKNNEVIVNMFAGVGTFSIIIAKKCKTTKHHAIDINPDAYQFILKNAFLNKVEDRITAYLGDAGRIIEYQLSGCADRVLMPYPEIAIEYFPFAIKALKDQGGTIHMYLHVKSKPIKDIINETLPKLDFGEKFILENISGRIVREVGPKLDQIVLDIKLKASKK
ncbi:MAG: class I SAM-dependent methyltransferase family protein [Nitrososphaeria archaeon]|nr:class I SAM-dependent methyltransferase family protein [Nitrososphaeria archaeon]